ncbi:hypothetical protein K435DRAFT_598858, partial [Dendrothele bispora CBS 962.96]
LDPEDNDDDEGYVDELEEMDEDEKKEFAEKVKPARWALAKIRRLAFKIINSMTNLLPTWKNTVCSKSDLPYKLIPRDVRTRWNSTYDLLAFACEYQEVIDIFTADR